MKCPYCDIQKNLFTHIFDHINETHQSILERKITLDILIVNPGVITNK